MTRPMLDGVELPQAQRIASADEEVLAQHAVPALEGDFLQGLGRRAVPVTLTGVLTGPEAAEDLKRLREKLDAAVPVPFVSDIATATRVDKVLIEEMNVRELAGSPERFEYTLSLREYTPPPVVTEEEPPVIPVPPVPETATLVVEVVVEGDPAFDFGTVTVTATGTQDDGTELSVTLTSRAGSTWTREDMPPGRYTVSAGSAGSAGSPGPPEMSGSAPATVEEGQTSQVTITLKPGSIAKAFVVHFWFDNAFVEPCMRAVLRRAAQHSNAHPDEKLIVVGHTDLTGSAEYNQSLSERRARSVFAAMIFGRDRAAGFAEWNELRKPATGGLPSVKDTWGTREVQYILQDLGYYSANVDGVSGSATDAAIRMFQKDKELTPVDGIVGDATWKALIEAYLGQDALAIPENRFLPNCPGEILKWLGCGEQDPVRNTEDAWRPNRRTELLFVKADALPCQVPQPDTFNLPSAGAVASGWCLGPGDPNDRACFLARGAAVPGRFLVQPAEPGTVTVRGSIHFEDGSPAANTPYVLVAPDGEYMDGEGVASPNRGRPVPGRTAADGTFSYPDKPKGVGVFTLEIQGLFLARRAGAPPEAAKGNIVCARLEEKDTLDVVVVPRPQDPSQPGPLAVGEDDYDPSTEGSFTIPPISGASNRAIQVGLRALIRYPAQSAGRRKPFAARDASYPLVVIAHGNHRATLPNGSPVFSFEGFEYLARHLASQGYVAISIDLNDVTSAGVDIPHRGETVLRHIQVMADRNASDPVFQGKIDLTRIALIGHSRGGEGVVAAQDINVRESRGRDIRAIFSIAPTDELHLTHSTTPYLVAVGSADSDVHPDTPATLYDRAAPLKSMLYIYGGIHNFFNTHSDWVRPNGTDFGERNIANLDNRVISPDQHLDVARGFATAFFEMVIRGQSVNLPYFNRYLRPASVAAVAIHHQFQDSQRFNVDDFEQEPLHIPRFGRNDEPVNSLGLPIERAALDNYEEWVLSSHGTNVGFLRWKNSQGEYRSLLNRPVSPGQPGQPGQPAQPARDVSGFRILALRVTLEFDGFQPEPLATSLNRPNLPQDFFVTLMDRQGRRASVQAGSITSIPYTYVHHDDLSRGVFGQESNSNQILKTIRVPLSRFLDRDPNLNLADVQAVILELRQTSSGNIAIDSIEFSN